MKIKKMPKLHDIFAQNIFFLNFGGSNCPAPSPALMPVMALNSMERGIKLNHVGLCNLKQTEMNKNMNTLDLLLLYILLQ